MSGNETEPINDNEDIEEYNIPSLNLSKDIKTKMEESGKRYPIWNPKDKGEVVGGLVENVEWMEHLNEGNGGWFIRLIDGDKNNLIVIPPERIHHVVMSGEVVCRVEFYDIVKDDKTSFKEGDRPGEGICECMG